jgi:hypothetical protein
MNKKEILKIAKQKYPIGCVIDSLGGCYNYKLDEKMYIEHPIKWSNQDICGYGVTLYNNGKWAKIISTPIKCYELW